MVKMADQRQELIKAYQKLMSIKDECTSKVCGLYSVAEMTVKQIHYLKIIDSSDNMTFGELAEKTKITKPSVTDLISKLEGFGCVYKEKSAEDARVSYIRLTEKGINIARHEKTALTNLIDRMMKSLSTDEIIELIKIFNSVK
jgi:DNA-binding MarR family transcriptional regulator